jgi:hypothetical protein
MCVEIATSVSNLFVNLRFFLNKKLNFRGDQAIHLYMENKNKKYITPILVI